MNYQKLNELSAKAMGYEELHLPKDGGRNPFVMYSRPGMDNIVTGDWKPSTCADDALALAYKVRGNRRLEIEIYDGCELTRARIVNTEFGPRLPGNKASENTFPLALTVVSLRAAGIPESSITETEDK